MHPVPDTQIRQLSSGQALPSYKNQHFQIILSINRFVSNFPLCDNGASF